VRKSVWGGVGATRDRSGVWQWELIAAEFLLAEAIHALKE
jgi:hypothetical protein